MPVPFALGVFAQSSNAFSAFALTGRGDLVRRGELAHRRHLGAHAQRLVVDQAAEAFDDPDIVRMYSEAVKWVLGLTEGDEQPHPARR